MADVENKGPMHSLNPNLQGMKSSATLAINEASNRLLAEGKQIFKLGLGQSPFPVPAVVVEALREHAYRKDYLPVRGLPKLRQAVAAYHARREGVERGGGDVLIGPGSKELIFQLQLVYQGELLLPSPSWVSYGPQATILGLPVRWVPTREQDDWRLTAGAFDQSCASGGERPRVLILNYPNNPTGGSYNQDELREIAEVARRRRVLLVSDEVYGEVHHAGAHISVARFYPEGTVISSGLSKWCGAGGWRLGTFLFPPELRAVQDAMAVVASETYTTVSAPIQHAAVTAYSDAPEIADYLVQSRRVLGALGNWAARALVDAGARCTTPVGGFYLFADLGTAPARFAERGIATGAELCARLLEDTGVAVLPGAEFGRPEEELSVRISYVDFDGEAALDAAAATDEEHDLDEEFLRAHCPRTVEGIERLCAWIR